MNLKKRGNRKKINGLYKILAITLVTMIYSSALGALIDKNIASVTVNAMEYVVRSEDNADILNQKEQEDFTLHPSDYPQKYVKKDTELLMNTSIPSATITKLDKKELVYVLYAEGEYVYVTTTDNLNGYVKEADLTDDLNEIFDSYERELYAKEGARLMTAPDMGSEVAVYLEEDDVVSIIGNNDGEYFMAAYGDDVVYIHEDDVSATSSTPANNGEIQGNPNWDGTVLTPSAGVIMGPSGKETYYNLNMSGVVSILQGMGVSGEYWVRDDGVKMYGDYIMAACAFDIRPRGSYVETSLGTAICADTGTFAYDNPTQVDIAVNW